MADRAPNEGVRLLREEARRRGWTQNELARQLGVHSGLMSHWMRGRQRPGRTAAAEIQKLLGISPESFDIRAAS